jgi:hypothetical protein
VRYGQGYFMARPGRRSRPIRASVRRSIRARRAPPSARAAGQLAPEFDDHGDLDATASTDDRDRGRPRLERGAAAGRRARRPTPTQRAGRGGRTAGSALDDDGPTPATARRRSSQLPRSLADDERSEETPLHHDDEPARARRAAASRRRPARRPLIDSLIELRAEPTSEKEPAAPGERRRDGLN